MKHFKITLSALVALFFFIAQLHCEQYKKIFVELPYGSSTILSTFFVFNDIETGNYVAKEFFGINDFANIARTHQFERLIPLPLGSELSAWNYAIMRWRHEFWIFKNNDDGYLWGFGFYPE